MTNQNSANSRMELLRWVIIEEERGVRPFKVRMFCCLLGAHVSCAAAEECGPDAWSAHVVTSVAAPVAYVPQSSQGSA